MVVGESPSKTRPAGMQDVAFSGRTSHILWDELKKYNITREDCYVTNIITDHVDWSDITSAIATKNEIRLNNEIDSFRPDVILAVGTQSVNHFLHTIQSITALAGTIHKLDLERNGGPKHKPWVVPCIHPSAVARNPELKNKFIDCIYVLSEVLKELGKDN
jgi:uracil-DNA glycosylase family 4